MIFTSARSLRCASPRAPRLIKVRTGHSDYHVPLILLIPPGVKTTNATNSCGRLLVPCAHKSASDERHDRHRFTPLDGIPCYPRVRGNRIHSCESYRHYIGIRPTCRGPSARGLACQSHVCLSPSRHRGSRACVAILSALLASHGPGATAPGDAPGRPELRDVSTGSRRDDGSKGPGGAR